MRLTRHTWILSVSVAAACCSGVAGSAQTLRDRLDRLPFELQGFVHSRASVRTQDDPNQSRRAILQDFRVQLEAAKYLDLGEVRAKNDVYFDGHEEKLELDLREANIFLYPTHWLDIKLGRQILTWGVGDLLFINDLFPKDWQSFFIGREVLYLKAPSDAVKATALAPWAQINVVYVPRFDPDRYLDGERVSFYDPFAGRFTGTDYRINASEPDRWFRDSELAWRVQKNKAGFDLAGYGYYGYWKSPAGFDSNSGALTFPGLWVHGASAQGQLHGGIFSLELGHYASRDDSEGSDPFIRNSEIRLLAGYTRDTATDLNLSGQYYVEYMQHHGALKRSLPPGRAPDEVYHLLTFRSTKLLLNQNLTLSFFAFYSPSNRDAYLRPRVSYKLTDYWTVDMGANQFFGREPTTFWSQFEHNSNVYTGLRWSF